MVKLKYGMFGIQKGSEMDKKELGRFGEEIASRYMEKEGYEILERNFRCRIGEVDIIAQKDNEIAFIEVKARTSDEFGLPREAVDTKKQNVIRKVAAVYLLSAKGKDKQPRFDVMEVYCNLIKAAF